MSEEEHRAYGLPIYGTIYSSDLKLSDDNPVTIHVCRKWSGNILFSVDDVDIQMTREEVSWLAAKLIAALDNWPVTG